jgi:hypothetical protein
MREMIGGCLCGQVRYSANADHPGVFVCHCEDCQKQTGTAFAIFVAVAKSAISTQGLLKTFHDKADTGQLVERSFCPECGSPIVFNSAGNPGLTFIYGGTLDDTSWLDPKVQVYCDSKEQWTPIPEGSRKFAKDYTPA